MGTHLQGQMLAEYWQTEENFPAFKGNPIDNLKEFFSNDIPLLLIAGTADMSVAFEKNAGAVIEYCNKHNIEITAVVKENVGHHPHSLVDTTIIEEFCENE
jgi:pimeloyl-ACP methyl ester carboxylesterase